jgi:hypothetical protein
MVEDDDRLEVGVAMAGLGCRGKVATCTGVTA